MFDVLDSITRAEQELGQSSLALIERTPPQIIAIEHHQIEGESDRLMIPRAAMQGIEIGNAFGIETDDLGVDNR